MGKPYDVFGSEIVEKMEDIIAYDFAPSAKTIAKRKAEQEETERLEEEKKFEPFLEKEGEENLKNIDEYYRD